MTGTPESPFTPLEVAHIEADALAGALEDHVAAMDPLDHRDLRKERQLHRAATVAALLVRHLQQVAS